MLFEIYEMREDWKSDGCDETLKRENRPCEGIDFLESLNQDVVSSIIHRESPRVCDTCKVLE